MTAKPVPFENPSLKGEWNHQLSAFYFSGNGLEFIAWKGSHQIFVYDPEQNPYPAPPARIIQYSARIETLEAFDLALDDGVTFEASYRPEGSPDPLAKLEAMVDRRLLRADKTADAIKAKHEGKEQNQPEHPDNAKLRSLMSEEELETKTEYNYHGGRSLGFWEGRGAALDDVAGWVKDLKGDMAK